ncbi:hypothetical protein [Variovorax sp. V15]|uniref:hypothetical protein n=1 Tax=Variovorax sp. V15 TaxID=3065952 RepID=UPI0034E8F88C
MKHADTHSIMERLKMHARRASREAKPMSAAIPLHIAVWVVRGRGVVLHAVSELSGWRAVRGKETAASASFFLSFSPRHFTHCPGDDDAR